MLVVKETLKNNDFIRNNLLAVEKRLFAILVKSSPVLATKYKYRRALGKSINLDTPKRLMRKYSG